MINQIIDEYNIKITIKSKTNIIIKMFFIFTAVIYLNEQIISNYYYDYVIKRKQNHLILYIDN
jgi:hypothetical protein